MLAFDPFLGFADEALDIVNESLEVFYFQISRGNRFSDMQDHRMRINGECFFRHHLECAGKGQRHDRGAGSQRNLHAAAFERIDFAVAGACAFRENEDGPTLVDRLDAALDALERFAWIGAVDQDMAEKEEKQADYRYPDHLFLGEKACVLTGITEQHEYIQHALVIADEDCGF